MRIGFFNIAKWDILFFVRINIKIIYYYDIFKMSKIVFFSYIYGSFLTSVILPCVWLYIINCLKLQSWKSKVFLNILISCPSFKQFVSTPCLVYHLQVNFSSGFNSRRCLRLPDCRTKREAYLRLHIIEKKNRIRKCFI